MGRDLVAGMRLGRRTLITSSFAGSFSFLSGCQETVPSRSPRQIMLWPETPPGGGGPKGGERTTPSGALYNIREPRLEIFRPERPNGSAVLVAAGGGYQRIGMRREAYPAARWLNARGITAFVLVYRLPGEGWVQGPMAPLQDARRALALIRQHASAENLDLARLTVLGFSAGGHLMGMTATGWAGPGSGADTGTVLPALAGAALIYPVITLEKPYDHTSTHRVLVGTRADAALARLWSVQTHVIPGYPSVFLTQADNDHIANSYNATLMAKCCQAVGTEADYRRLPSGGHGFGMGESGRITSQWPVWYQDWLTTHGLI